MIRINRSLLTFVGLISVLGASTLIVLDKLIPFARHQGYYCQSVSDSFQMPISHVIGSLPFIILFTFLVTAIAKLLFVFGKAHLLRRGLSKRGRYNKTILGLLEKLDLTDRTYIIKSNKKFAFCLGIRKPKIYISTGFIKILTVDEVEAVLRHERYHLDNRDTLTMIIASIGESLLPFFPLLSDFLLNYRIEREIRADQEAVKGLGNEKAIISVLKKMLWVKSISVVPAAAIAEQDTLEPRILKLLKKESHFRKFKMSHVVISVVSAFIIALIVISPVKAFEVHEIGKYVMMICPYGGSCMISCKQEYSTDENDHSEELLYTPMK